MKKKTFAAMKKFVIASLLGLSPAAFAQGGDTATANPTANPTANVTADTPTANPTANPTADVPTANPTADVPTANPTANPATNEGPHAAQAPGANVDKPSGAGSTDQPHVGANEHEGAAGGHGGHGDPSKHFNWASNWFSYSKKDVYGGPLGDGKMVDHDGNVVMHQDSTGKMVPAEEEGMSPPFVFMLLNFGLLLLILAKYGGPAARKLAQERHDQIKTALDEAAKLRDQAQQKLTEYETRIKDVDTEVKKLVDGIRADAEADKARILETASKQAAQMKKDAEQRIAAEIELARAQLQREVALAASGATEKLLREKMTADDQTKLVSTFIGNVSAPGQKEAR